MQSVKSNHMVFSMLGENDSLVALKRQSVELFMDQTKIGGTQTTYPSRTEWWAGVRVNRCSWLLK